MSQVIKLKNSGDYHKFKKSHRRGIIFYSAEWCSACEQIEPMYNRIANKYYRKIAFAHVDIDECNLDFSKIPVFVSFHNGKQLDSMEGADTETLKIFIKDAIRFNSTPSTYHNIHEIQLRDVSKAPIHSGSLIQHAYISKRDTNSKTMVSKHKPIITSM
jgi:thioredoxin-like negative regulator of GroEL